MAKTKEELEAQLNSVQEDLLALQVERNVIKDLEKKEKTLKKKIKDLKPVYVDVDDQPILSLSDPTEDSIDELKDEGLKIIGNYGGDLFEDDFPDGGEDYEAHFLIGSKLFKSVIHFEAEWIGDWSMRCNVPTNPSMKSWEEIKDFELQCELPDELSKFDTFCAKYVKLK